MSIVIGTNILECDFLIMQNPLRLYIDEIGYYLIKLGTVLRQEARNTNHSMRIHPEIIYKSNTIIFALHQLSADLDTWRKEMLAKEGKIELPKIFEGTDGVNVESAYWAVNHLLNASTYDVDSGKELTFTEELRKLEWLFEELQNMPEPLRYSKASYEDFSFDKITGNR